MRKMLALLFSHSEKTPLFKKSARFLHLTGDEASTIVRNSSAVNVGILTSETAGSVGI